jgi:diguanylate cyclase (GGDEF)-like protein
MATQTDTNRDSLTGLLNREGFAAAFLDLSAADAVAVAVIDMDDFKTVNDTFGHAVGDQLIQASARSLAGSLPTDSIVARMGGDEFVVALPGSSAESALILLEEIRAHLATHVPVPPIPEIDRPATLTVGIAARPPHGATLDELLRAADSAMYRAKAEGGNRVAIHVDEKMVMKSNYYDRAALARLGKLSQNVGRTEASLLREALDDLFDKHKAQL